MRFFPGVRTIDAEIETIDQEKKMATYTKLKDGSWGVRVEGTAKSGQSVTVTKKSGETKSETIGRVLWSGNGISLCSVGQSSGNGSHSTHRPGRCANCGGACDPKYRRCLDCVDGGSRAHGGMSYYDKNGHFVLGDDD